MFGLEGAFLRHPDVVGLFLAQLGQLHVELGEVERGDLFVEVLGQHVNRVFVFARLGEQLDLRDDLVAEAVRHHEARVSGGAAEVQQATLATVAPGISEALIATAMGLFAAIPAVIAYNRFSAISDALLKNYETFADEFSSILHRRVHNSEQSAA